MSSAASWYGACPEAGCGTLQRCQSARMTMGRRRPLGLGLLLALAVEPPLLLPLLSSATQAGLAAKSSASLSAPSPNVNRAGTMLHRSTAVTDEGLARPVALPQAFRALLTWGPLAVAQDPINRRESPD